MARMLPRTYRVRRAGNTITVSFADATRSWDVVLPIERAGEFATHLSRAVAGASQDPKAALGPASAMEDGRYKTEFRAYENGLVGVVIIASGGELEAPYTIAEAEVLLGKLAGVIAAAKAGAPKRGLPH